MRSTAYEATFLENGFPYREISLVLSADRRMNDPAYRVHRWWARRPPSLMRALLIAAASDGRIDQGTFWERFSSSDSFLAGWRVLDPFAGGGTTLVEARRLGAKVWGGDVDPLAVRITAFELNPAERGEVEEAGASLMQDLDAHLSRYYATGQGTPLHYLKVRSVICPDCKHEDLLYRSLVLARSTGAAGSVVRDAALTVFCPTCRAIHYFDDPDRSRLHCCGRYYDLWSGTYFRGHYTCESCGAEQTHQMLQSGIAPEILIGVEQTPDDGRRIICPPSTVDLDAMRRAEQYWSANSAQLGWVPRPLRAASDGRPQSFGICELDQLFSPRQLLMFAFARRWLDGCAMDQRVREAIALALSNAVTTNNRLCGYAIDYGRISPLFSVRGYSLPALSVELNPLHNSAGRGTLQACLHRVAKASEPRVLRHTWSSEEQKVMPHAFTFRRRTAAVDFGLRSAIRPIPDSKQSSADLCVFDPPYFDFINYDDLSYLQRVMGGLVRRGGAPLHPQSEEEDLSFREGLSTAFERCVDGTREGMPLVFTYHASSEVAWNVVGEALDEAKLCVTAAWPVLSDSHMGHHSYPGNCEWDVALVCRPLTQVMPTQFKATVGQWAASVRPLRVSDSDRRNFTYAIAMCGERFGILPEGEADEDRRGA